LRYTHAATEQEQVGGEGVICEGEKRVIKAKMLAKNI